MLKLYLKCLKENEMFYKGTVESSGGEVVKALPSHQYGPGLIPRLSAICGLSLLNFFSALRGFSPGTPVFPFPQKPTFDRI